MRAFVTRIVQAFFDAFVPDDLDDDDDDDDRPLCRLTPDECLLVRRGGRWVCVRDHDHDPVVVDMIRKGNL
ncbi:hypothetical protein [Rhodococcus sp. 11-3]|uniref:hypothetical protein n=1 Tax=Rhodococcus sp. 11-3 TaxID=2854796 RepID=UPI00203D63D8|nr:hypothetical protein [Rhodococcus sp. 11-3]USC17012.1 hypothetical protein KZJ41_09160 [Rhodococcus sp. 11-3]